MKEFLTSKEAQDVLCKANEQLLKYPCLRFGQSLFNEMVEHYPKMKWIRGTRYDMYYRSVEESYDLLYKLIKDSIL